MWINKGICLRVLCLRGGSWCWSSLSPHGEKAGYLDVWLAFNVCFIYFKQLRGLKWKSQRVGCLQREMLFKFHFLLSMRSDFGSDCLVGSPASSVLMPCLPVSPREMMSNSLVTGEKALSAPGAWVPMKKPFWLSFSVLLKILAAATKLHRIPGIVVKRDWLSGQENAVTEKANVVGLVAQLCPHSSREPETGKSQDMPGLLSEFKTTLINSLIESSSQNKK